MISAGVMIIVITAIDLVIMRPNIAARAPLTAGPDSVSEPVN